MPTPRFPLSRRQFLRQGAALGGFGLCASTSVARLRSIPLAPSTGGDGRTLVAIQLNGGNDGLSTVIPFAHDVYRAARTTTRHEPSDVIKLDDERALHPALKGVSSLWDRGDLAIVEGVGYPEPNRSHFSSFDIWHAASPLGRQAGEGWLARLARSLGGDPDPNRMVYMGSRLPYAFYSETEGAACFVDPASYRWNRNADPIASAVSSTPTSGALAAIRETFANARKSSETVRAAVERYRPRVDYPVSNLGSALRAVAALIQEGVGSRILCIDLQGFDTHGGQRPAHDRLMGELDTGVSAFLDDLRGTDGGKRTLTFAYSEFGRRVKENQSGGTDHGAAGPCFLAGPGVVGGLYGAAPSFTELDQGDLIHTTDFRSVYATIIQRWFGVDPDTVLHESHPLLDCLES